MTKVAFDEHSARSSGNLVWRMNAVRLAVEKNRIGKAIPHHEIDGVQMFLVSSSTEPTDHVVAFETASGLTSCTCEAGSRSQPCAHAGAVLLFICGLAPTSKE